MSVEVSVCDKKWSCNRCTYQNFSKAKKCCMCSHVRQSIHLIIDDNNSHQNGSQDIYKMSPLIESNHELSDDKNLMNSVIGSNKKWSCNVCTFLNYINSIKCTQCLTVRKIQNTKTISDTDSPQLTSLAVTTNESATNRSTPDGQLITTAITNTNTTISSDSYHNDRNKSETIGLQSGFKWSCTACTYDNWEAAKKCVLCFTSRKTDSNGVQQAFTSSELSSEERRRNTPSPPIAAKGTTIITNNYKNQNNKNKINESIDITSAANEHINYIEDRRNERCNDLYDYDILIANSSRPIAKRAPSDVSRYLATEIRRSFSSGLKQRKGDFACYFVSEFVTFALPAEVEDLSPQIQERLFDEYLDRDVQKELEEESPIINWSIELTERLGSRLYALWNRSTGDCLLDSVLQATWGIFDRDNILRKALGDSLSEASSHLFLRFKEAETLQANLLHFTLDDDQWQEDWAVILSLATQPGQSLEQIHIFTLAHILRRPIIVYAIRIVKSFRGETLGYAGYEGIYLPLMWESSFCWKSPIALGYTRGHFSALVPIEPESSDEHIGAGANFRSTDDNEVIFLPLVTSEQQLLPLHFLGQNELGREEEIMRQWLDCCVTTGGILAAKQKIPRKPLLVAQMMDEWLDFYRNLTQTSIPHTVKNNVAQDFSSDADSD